jgi:hypothetical protein
LNSTPISPVHTRTLYNGECEKGRSCFPFKAANKAYSPPGTEENHENIKGFGAVTTAMPIHLLGYKHVKATENQPSSRLKSNAIMNQAGSLAPKSWLHPKQQKL